MQIHANIVTICCILLHFISSGWNSLGAALQAFLRADVNDVKNVSITVEVCLPRNQWFQHRSWAAREEDGCVLATAALFRGF